ncbi:MAG TPA: DUF4255 domain-containing protein [Myxococcales bacterium]
MSTALAPASVTFVLIDLLNNGLIDRDISSTGVGEVTVTALPPDRMELLNQGQSQLDLFLWQVSHNAAWRNVGYPSRNAQGERIDNPPLALDLHYLLVAYGAQPLHAEILLGYGMQLLHETPVLTREAIRRSLAAPTQVAVGSGLPPTMLNLYASELAEQIEAIKIAPETLGADELSKMWTAFQAHYRPHAAYQVSVVLIERRVSTKAALPVGSRRLRAISLQSPVIERVLSRKSGSDVITDQPIVVGDSLVLVGAQLRGEQTTVDVGGIELAPSGADLTPSRIVVPVPSTLLAGLQSVQVVQRIALGTPGIPHRVVESNVATFTLRPTLSAASAMVQGTGADLRSGTLDVTVDPAVGPGQQVAVLLNPLPGSPPGAAAPSYRFVVPARVDLASPPSSPPAPATSLEVPFDGVVAGSYLVRIQVDGAESPLETDADGRYSGPAVDIP